MPHSAPGFATGGTASKEEDKVQIEFLNSVIVDQQHKIEELNQKIKVLAEVGDTGHNGFDLDFRYIF